MPSPTGLQIYDPQGHRLYLTGSERTAFRTAAEAAPREVRTYCWTLLHTGCRPSEALDLTADRVDVQAAVLTFESRKKRRLGLYRAVPVHATLLDALDLVHGLPVFSPVTHARSGGAGKGGEAFASWRARQRWRGVNRTSLPPHTLPRTPQTAGERYRNRRAFPILDFSEHAYGFPADAP
jgi:integrase